MRDYLPEPPCSQTGEAFRKRSLQVGTLLVATIADDGRVAVQVVGQGVKFSSAAFSADSKSMAYVDGYDACSLGGVLKTAAADGTNPQAIEFVPVDFQESIVGNTLLFVRPGATGLVGQVYALSLPDGTPMAIPGASDASTGVWMSPDGRRAAYVDATGAAMVLDVSTGASHPTGIEIDAVSFGSLLWSPNGAYLALEYSPASAQQVGLAVAAVGDTQASHLSNNLLIGTSNYDPEHHEVFSPDSARLAYQALDSAGAPELVVHPLAGGADVHVQGLPDPASNIVYTTFSPDGVVVIVTSTDSATNVTSLFTASAIGSGSLQLITSGGNGVFAMPPGDGNLAVELGPGSTQVYSFSGAASKLLPGGSPVYEPDSAQPRLLVYVYPPGSPSDPIPAFVLASTDGTGMNPVSLPTGASAWAAPQWMGHTVMYGFWLDPALTGTVPALYASSGDGSSPTLLAAGPDKYAWAPIPVPTRLFYARTAANTAGPAGLWMVPLP